MAHNLLAPPLSEEPRLVHLLFKVSGSDPGSRHGVSIEDCNEIFMYAMSMLSSLCPTVEFEISADVLCNCVV